MASEQGHGNWKKTISCLWSHGRWQYLGAFFHFSVPTDSLRLGTRLVTSVTEMGIFQPDFHFQFPSIASIWAGRALNSQFSTWDSSSFVSYAGAIGFPPNVFHPANYRSNCIDTHRIDSTLSCLENHLTYAFLHHFREITSHISRVIGFFFKRSNLFHPYWLYVQPFLIYPH